MADPPPMTISTVAFSFCNTSTPLTMESIGGSGTTLEYTT